MGIPVLEIENVTKRFGKSITAVNDVSLTVEKGQVFGFLGPNGAGKTTTIRLVLGLLHPDHGTIRVCGNRVDRKGRTEALRATGALVEGPAFYPYLSGLENLKVFAAYTGEGAEKRIPRLIDLVGLSGRERDSLGGYSLGMKQRLGIAQALLNNPRLLILDEPTNGLDPYGVKDIRQLIRRLARELGTTVFLSSHILSEVQNTCDSVAIINHGKMVVQGSVSRLLSQGNDLFEISSADAKEVTAFLEKKPGCSVYSENPLRVKAETIPAEVLLSDIVKAGFSIREFKEAALSLEDFFFSATKEDEYALSQG
ncbi:MAG: ABC transporter ATP-binding protein [Spirochaetia bacterium]